MFFSDQAYFEVEFMKKRLPDYIGTSTVGAVHTVYRYHLFVSLEDSKASVCFLASKFYRYRTLPGRVGRYLPITFFSL